MGITLQDLLVPVTADDAKALLLETLQGIGPVQQIGTGAGVVVASGSPVNSYDVVIKVTTSGAPGTGQFSYSLDNGITFSSPIGIPGGGSYSATGTGMTFVFAGSFVAGDQYLFQTVFPPFSVNDWESGSTARTLVEMDAVTLADLAGTAVPDIAGGGFVDYADTDWLTLESDQLYENDRYPAVATQGLVVLSLAASAPPLTIAAGDIIVSNSSGSGTNVYQFSNTTGLTISPGTSVTLNFEAQQPGAAYNVQNGTLTVLKTPKPGLTATNPEPGNSSVTHTGGGSGTVTPSGFPNGNFSIVVRIVTNGGLGVGQAQVSLDGGASYASPLTIPGSGVYQVPTLNGLSMTGVTVTFAGTFTAGDLYSFTSYASWITTPGSDEESDIALRGRDKNKWSALGVGGGTVATFDYLSRTAPGGGSEVVKTSVAASLSVAGQINVVVSGVNGPVSSSALAAIQSYVSSFTGLCAKSSVNNSATHTIAVVAQVLVRAAQLAAAQAAIDSAFAALVTSTPIGGEVPTAAIEACLYQPGFGVTDVYLTTPPPNTDTFLPAGSVPLFDLSGVTYVLV